MCNTVRQLRPYLPILCVMVLWGSMGIVSTRALAEFSPLFVLCLRSGFGALTLLPFALRMGLRPAAGERGLLVILSLLGVVLCNYLYFNALQLTQMTSVAIIYATSPLITVVLAAILLREPIRQSRLLGLLAAFSGVVLLLLGGEGGEMAFPVPGKGELAALLSVLCLSLYTIFSRRLKRTPPACAVFWMMAVSFLSTFPLVPLSGWETGPAASGWAWLSVFYLGVFCSGFGYLLQQKSIAAVGASASSAFLNGISPITILTAAVFLGEPIRPSQLFCMSAIMLGVVLNAANRDIFPPK